MRDTAPSVLVRRDELDRLGLRVALELAPPAPPHTCPTIDAVLALVDEAMNGTCWADYPTRAALKRQTDRTVGRIWRVMELIRAQNVRLRERGEWLESAIRVAVKIPRAKRRRQ